MARLTSQVTSSRPPSIPGAAALPSAQAPASSQPAVVPEQAPIAQDALPRRQIDDLSGGAAVGAHHKPVAAVMLGVTGVGVACGIPLTALAQDTVVVAPAEHAPEAAGASAELAASLASELDGARDSLAAEILADARREAWSAFVEGGASNAVPFELVALSTPAPAPASALLPLSGSVGPQSQNAKADVERVQARLQALGFDVKVDGDFGPQTLRALRVYEAMHTGVQTVSGASGRVVPGGALHRALSAESGPRWTRIPASGTGFVNADFDGHSHASSRLISVLADSARTYHEGYRAEHPGAAAMSTNDASLKKGGNTPDHESHENGLDLDVFLPTKSGGRGAKVGWASYDREATYAMISAFASDARVERILIGDNVLLQRIQRSSVPWKHKVQNGGADHRDHFHVDVSPSPIPSAAPRAIRST